MKTTLLISALLSLLTSCTIHNYYGATAAEEDDVYFVPGSEPIIAEEAPAPAPDISPAPEKQAAADDYWDDDYSDDIHAEGDVYIENYNASSGMIWPPPSSRFTTYYPYYTSFSLYYQNWGFYYDPWYGWQAGYSWNYHPLRPWTCSPYNNWFGGGWGYGWQCDPWYNPWGPGYGYGYGYGNPYGYYDPYGYGLGNGYPYYPQDQNNNSSDYYYGHRDPVETATSENSGYSNQSIYSIDRFYEEHKPLAQTRPENIAISRPGLNDWTPAAHPGFQPGVYDPGKRPDEDSSPSIRQELPRDRTPALDPIPDPDGLDKVPPAEVRPETPSEDGKRPSRDRSPGNPVRERDRDDYQVPRQNDRPFDGGGSPQREPRSPTRNPGRR